MKHKILIADDEAEIRNLLRLYLENEGYDVTEAKDGVEALRLLRDEKPDLCLLDIMMPASDGYRVLKELRETSNIPVIFISAKDADSEKILTWGRMIISQNHLIPLKQWQESIPISEDFIRWELRAVR